MTTADKLRAARVLIENPERWCQGAFRSNGKYCAKGALFHVKADNFAHGFLRRAAQKTSGRIYWLPEHLNDQTDHPTVLKMFDLAIAMAEEK
jgi:hypothetical protein